MGRVSVIIVNYNAGQELTASVASLLQAEAVDEIIVVDNASSDASIRELCGTFPEESHPLKVLSNQKNLGFAVACNQGARVARGACLLYLNPDCLVEPDTVVVLLNALRDEPRAGMVGGLILNHDGSEQRGCRRMVPTPWKSFVNSMGLRFLSRWWPGVFTDFRMDGTPLPDRPVAVDSISGACMLVRREALIDVGPFDEEYFLHCEDLDWCMRFRLRGWKIMFVPKARLKHSKGSCSLSRPVFVEWSKHKGMVRFSGKFFANLYPRPVFLLICLGIWLRFGISLGKILLRKTVSGVRK